MPRVGKLVLRLQMLDAQYFLTEGNGYKGDQVSVLLPGEYRPNPRLFSIDVVPVLEVPVGRSCRN